jgi:hypothetical protein
MTAQKALSNLAIVFGLLLVSHVAGAKEMVDPPGPLYCEHINVEMAVWLVVKMDAERTKITIIRGWHGKPEEYTARKIQGDGLTSVSYEASSWRESMVLKLDVREGDSFTYNSGDKIGVECSFPESTNKGPAPKVIHLN